MDFFNQSSLNAIGQKLIIDGNTVSVAEEVTSGFLQLAFAHMDNSSLFYKGGITVTNLEDITGFLDLKYNDKTRRNCKELLEAVTALAALKTSEVLKSDWSISAAGFDTPKRGSCYKIFVDYIFCFQGEIILSEHFEIDSTIKPLDAHIVFTKHILEHFGKIINA